MALQQRGNEIWDVSAAGQRFVRQGTLGRTENIFEGGTNSNTFGFSADEEQGQRLPPATPFSGSMDNNFEGPVLPGQLTAQQLNQQNAPAPFGPGQFAQQASGMPSVEGWRVPQTGQQGFGGFDKESDDGGSSWRPTARFAPFRDNDYGVPPPSTQGTNATRDNAMPTYDPVTGQMVRGYQPLDLQRENPGYGAYDTGAGRNISPVDGANVDPYNVSDQGGTDAEPVATTKNIVVNNAVTNAFMDPDPQNGINVMLGLLKGTPDGKTPPGFTPLDEGSKQALLANIGQLYTAMQTSNPYGYSQEDFAAEAALDRSSQEQIARGGLTANYISNVDAKNRATENYAIDANRYATEQGLEGQKYSADAAAAGVRGAAALTGAATQYASKQAADATVEVADLAFEGLKYSTDENSTSAITIAATQKAAVVYTAQANERLSAESGLSHERVAEIQKQASVDVAQANGLNALAVAAMNAGGAEQVAISQGWSAEQVAAIQRESANQVASQTGLTELMVANIMESAKTSVAEIMADAQTEAATTSANPFDLSGQQFLDMQGTQARGGLTVDQRMAEISAANEPERLAALLGTLDPRVQGTLQGFGMTAPPTVPTISNLRNTSAERQQYIEGLFGSFGVSPSILANLVNSVSPGSPFGASTFA